MSTPVRFKARLSRDGLQHYVSGAQYRPTSEVFAPESLAGLDNLRVQRGHDPMRGVSVGHVVPGTIARLDNADSEGRNYVTATLEITDPATIADIRAGRLTGISLGYTCELQTDAAGRAVQTNIRFAGPDAHVALLDSRVESPRCGEHCQINQRDSNVRVYQTDEGGTIDAANSACQCTANNQAERDRIEGWLAGAAARYGVSTDSIVAAIPRGVDVTLDAVFAAATSLVRQDSDEQFRQRLQSGNATWIPQGSGVPQRRHHDAVTLINDSDDAFRVHLAQQSRQDSGDTLESAVAAAAPDADPSTRAAIMGLARNLVAAHGYTVASAVKAAVLQTLGHRTDARPAPHSLRGQPLETSNEHHV